MGDWVSIGANFAGDLLGLNAEEPPRRRYDRELEGTLNTQIQLAPDLYAAEASEEFGQPAYARLALRNLGILAPGFEEAFGGMTSRSRRRTADDLSSVAPGLFNLYAGLDPNQQQLMGQLNEDALTGLRSGNQLSSSDVYNVTNPVRMDWANRGLGPSGAAQLDEAVRLATAGEALRGQRQQFASGVAGLNLATSAPAFDSISRIGTDSSTAFGFGSLINPTLQGLGPLFQPESQYAADINSQLYNTQAAISAGNAANRGNFLGSLLGFASGGGRG